MALARLFGNGQPETKDPYGAPGSGKSNFISAVTIVVILLGWWLATELELVRALFLPSPGLVFSKFLKIACYDHYKEAFLVFLGVQAEVVAECEGFSENALHQHILWSLYRVFSSFLLAVVTAIPIGIAMGMNRIARGVFDPPIEFYRPIPPLAYLPLTIIWFGIGDFAKIFLIYLACFAPLAISARAGVRSCSIEQIHAAYSMGASRHQVLWHVVLHRLRLDHLGGRRDGRRQGGDRRHGAERGALSRDRYRLPGHRRDRPDRLLLRRADAQGRAPPGPLEGQGLGARSAFIPRQTRRCLP
jgi:taurine transport system permease protein